MGARDGEQERAANRLADLVERLRSPAAYPHPVGEVRVLQTHISYVLLAGEYAYKIKKPVDFGFLDFRTLRRRWHFCCREVQLNSRLSPGLYLGVVPIVRDGDAVRVDAQGEIVEYAVKMRRLPADRMMDALVDSGAVEPAQVARVAERMARFHAEAASGPRVARFGSIDEITRDWDENFRQTEPFVGSTHSADQHRLLAEYVRASLTRLRPLLLDRIRTLRIREGHGDLRTSAVCFDPACAGGMCIFDCIEFNRRFRCCDVASEMAFLAMDLELHDRPDLAEALIDRYAAASGDAGVRRLLPFYGCYRAYVRGKVEGFRFAEAEVTAGDRAEALRVARKAFALAVRYAERDRPPLLVLMSGLSGTGKTTLARAIAARQPFELMSSDVVRKELARVPLAESRAAGYAQALYTAERRHQVYAELDRRARAALARGRSVILDATFGERSERERAARTAQEVGAYFFAVECRVDEASVRRRMDDRERSGSVSDARFEVYLRQRGAFEPLDELDLWQHVLADTSVPLERCAAAVLAALDQRLRPRSAGAAERVATLDRPP